MKVGDVVYTVADYGDPKIESAIVKAVTDKTVRLGAADGSNRTGLGFNCRVRFDAARVFARTEREAWQEFIEEQERSLATMENDIAETKKAIKHARKQL